MSSKFNLFYKSTIFAAFLLCALAVSAYPQNLRAEEFGAAGANKNQPAQNTDPSRRSPAQTLSAGQNKAFNLSTARIYELERQTFALINQKRAEMKLPALEWNDEVANVARAHSENMVKFDFFSHAGQDGTMVDDRVEAFGIDKWQAIGENIAFNRGFQNPVETAVERWLLSPSHKANLLGDRWAETGIGIAVKADGSFYFTQVFLKR